MSRLVCSLEEIVPWKNLIPEFISCCQFKYCKLLLSGNDVLVLNLHALAKDLKSISAKREDLGQMPQWLSTGGKNAGQALVKSAEEIGGNRVAAVRLNQLSLAANAVGAIWF